MPRQPLLRLLLQHPQLRLLRRQHPQQQQHPAAAKGMLLVLLLGLQGATVVASVVLLATMTGM
jgi:hypothetical protein